MYLHICPDIALPIDRIVAILDWEKLNKTKRKKAVIQEYLRQIKMFDVSVGRPKSLICLSDNSAYLSPISPLTLRKRGTDIAFLGGF